MIERHLANHGISTSPTDEHQIPHHRSFPDNPPGRTRRRSPQLHCSVRHLYPTPRLTHFSSNTHRRHGWSRTFSITPEQLSNLDYITLEVLLELPTLKLRSSSLRVFVENPPQSGTFSKIRFWKDDGSLQSVLVKQFFEQRREDNIVCLLDVRDGNQREDTGSILGGMGGLGSGRMVLKPGQAKEWYKRSRSANRSTTSVGTTGTALDGRTDDEELDVQPVRVFFLSSFEFCVILVKRHV